MVETHSYANTEEEFDGNKIVSLLKKAIESARFKEYKVYSQDEWVHGYIKVGSRTISFKQKNGGVYECIIARNENDGQSGYTHKIASKTKDILYNPLRYIRRRPKGTLLEISLSGKPAEVIGELACYADLPDSTLEDVWQGEIRGTKKYPEAYH